MTWTSTAPGPFQANGKLYPQIEFETNVGASEALCNTTSGAGCAVPPAGSKFYPFWSLSPQRSGLGSHVTSCVWILANPEGSGVCRGPI